MYGDRDEEVRERVGNEAEEIEEKRGEKEREEIRGKGVGEREKRSDDRTDGGRTVCRPKVRRVVHAVAWVRECRLVILWLLSVQKDKHTDSTSCITACIANAIP